MLEEKTCELLCKKTLTKAEKDVKSEVFGLTSSKFPRFSPFRAHVRKVLARFKGFRRQDRFRNMIADEYLVNWIVDNLPAITRYRQTGAINGVLMLFGPFRSRWSQKFEAPTTSSPMAFWWASHKVASTTCTTTLASSYTSIRTRRSIRATGS